MQLRTLVTLAVALLSLAFAPAVNGQCSGCPSGQSGDIKVVRIDSNGAGTPETILCATEGTDLTINLANWSWSADNWVIHIFDCDSATTPTHHIGHVTISGNPGNIGLLAVFVGGATASWTDTPTTPLDAGCIDFGGLTISSESLRARTRASIAISGDVTRVSGSSGPDPDIHVNQIVRLQVEGRDGGTERLGGSIDGDVIADGGAAGFYGNTTNAIAQLRAWRAIRGTVQAVNKDIFAIRVVGDPNAAVAPEGISGDILATNGRIGTIYTTGPIGRASGTRLQITAGNTIRRIRAGYPNAVGEFTVLDKDFDFDVMSNALVAADPEAWTYSSPASDGTLEMIQTDGDLTGTVRATNIACALSGGTGLVPDPGETPCRPGIWVKGVMYADVDVDLFVYFGNIVARSMLGEIHIGRFIKGAIVATGGATPPDPLPSGWADGRIESLTIGRGELPSAASTNIFYAERGPGLCGVDDGNSDGMFVPSTPDDWFTAPDQDHGAIEGIVHAASAIGTADIASVSLTFNFTSGAPGCKTLAPRIEAPVIGALTIDDFATGSVWSGVWGSGAPAVGFAEIGTMRVGCMRQRASLWIRDWDSAVVTGNMFGNIIVPAVPADRSI
ncbi:MAG: hypothetical protein WAZ94_08365 [Phycisphaerales bacterium]